MAKSIHGVRGIQAAVEVDPLAVRFLAYPVFEKLVPDFSAIFLANKAEQDAPWLT